MLDCLTQTIYIHIYWRNVCVYIASCVMIICDTILCCPSPLPIVNGMVSPSLSLSIANPLVYPPCLRTRLPTQLHYIYCIPICVCLQASTSAVKQVGWQIAGVYRDLGMYTNLHGDIGTQAPKDVGVQCIGGQVPRRSQVCGCSNVLKLQVHNYAGVQMRM